MSGNAAARNDRPDRDGGGSSPSNGAPVRASGSSRGGSALNWDERGHVLATCDESVVYCRVVGLGNMNNCAPFQRYSLGMQQKGYREFILDFSSCDGLDSTFLGLLLGIVLGDRMTRCKVVVLNPTQHVRRILGEVGIDHLVNVCNKDVSLPEVPMQRLSASERPSEEEKLGMVVRAHENLCCVEGKNRDRFGRFLELVKGELEERGGKLAGDDPSGNMEVHE